VAIYLNCFCEEGVVSRCRDDEAILLSCHVILRSMMGMVEVVMRRENLTPDHFILSIL
jgi:hypothetical protein